jgi:hypothetical protein
VVRKKLGLALTSKTAGVARPGGVAFRII